MFELRGHSGKGDTFCVSASKKKVPGWKRPMARVIRDYSALTYLNADFTVDELVFPDVDLVIIPKAGLLVGYPSNHKFVYAVPKVLSGKRYSLPVWFTVDSTKAMQV